MFEFRNHHISNAGTAGKLALPIDLRGGAEQIGDLTAGELSVNRFLCFLFMFQATVVDCQFAGTGHLHLGAA